jgi:hypothetical protein
VIDRRHLHLVIALLLPLMVLRGLLPAGFMPAVRNGELRITMCSDGLQTGTRTPQHPDQHIRDDACPFAVAATLAPPPAVEALRFTVESAHSTQPPALRSRPAQPPRRPAARGPPAFS